jgi:hypothetical protein
MDCHALLSFIIYHHVIAVLCERQYGRARAVPTQPATADQELVLVQDPLNNASDSTRVPAPPGALAWTPDWGWILDELDLLQARAQDERVYRVGEDGLVREASGAASLTALMRLDREVHMLTRQIGDLIERLSNALEPLEP